MSEKPILFSTEMVQAILAGRKTQTRRVMKPQPERLGSGWMYEGDYFADTVQMESHLFHNVYGAKGSPYGAVYGDGSGDTLWVRETWATTEPWDNVEPSRLPRNGVPIYYCDDDFNGYKKRPSLFMPRWASRINLTITDVRIERLQDITEADAEAEGVELGAMDTGFDYVPSYVAEYAELWDTINGKTHPWHANPWVWVIEFEVMK